MSNNYKFIDNIPQKRNGVNTMDVQIINQMIEGFDTVQNTLDNIDSTNKYNLELNHEQVPIVIKPTEDKNLTKYVALVGNHYEQQDANAVEYVPKTSQKIGMDLTTRFYIGSLSIVGLFVLYRLIQKTK
jgi:hypothetical protein